MALLILISVLFSVNFCSFVSAYDLDPLQDLCVAVQDSNQSAVFVNGRFCKDPKLANADDFYASGFNVSGMPTPTNLGFSVNALNVNRMPGLNTLGISMARADLEPFGLVSPHIHPRATELILVLEVLVNGKICKDPKLAKADDFFASGLNVSGNAVPQLGFAVNIVDVNKMPGLNTLGISIVRADLEPQGLSPLHTHPRATELITILEGTIYAGFLTPDASNIFKSRLFSKIMNPGDVFVIPRGLIHFQYNVGHKNATLLASFNSQNPGVVMIPSTIFASDPPILDDVLAKGFRLDKKVINELRKKFS